MVQCACLLECTAVTEAGCSGQSGSADWALLPAGCATSVASRRPGWGRGSAFARASC